MVPILYYGVSNITFGGAVDLTEYMFSFPSVWGMITYLAGWFNLLMGVLVVIITCNEINHRMLRQNVIDGLSRSQAILSKFLVIFLLSFVVTIYVALIGFLSGMILGGGDVGPLEEFYYIPVYFIQTLGYFSFAFFFAILVKRPALAIIFYVLSIMLEGIVGLFLPSQVYQWFPLKIISELVPFPFLDELAAMATVQQSTIQNGQQTVETIPPEVYEITLGPNVAVACVYIFLFFATSYFILKKRDI